MEFFRHKNLALGAFGFLISLYFSYKMSRTLILFVLTASLFLIAAATTIYLITKRKSVLDLIIKYTPFCLLVCLAMLVALFSFCQDKSKLEYIDNEIHEITMTVESIEMREEYMSKLLVNVDMVDNEAESFRALATFYDNKAAFGDEIKATVKFIHLENSENYSEEKLYLDEGVAFAIEVMEYSIINLNQMPVRAFFRKINSSLSSFLHKHLNDDSASLISALLLGNKNELDTSVKRDFARLGISHVLALSGLHLTIIVTLLSTFLEGAEVSLFKRTMILISAIILFIALTGFSASAIRAGIMLSIFFISSCFGFITDKITALFCSVALICFVCPYWIYSLSLQLSLLAMLGCFTSAKIIVRLRLYQKFKNSVIRYFLFVIITTVFVIGFTLPVTFASFRELSLLTAFSNALFVPAFTVIMYFAPFAILFLTVPYINIVFVFITELLCGTILKLGTYFASLKWASISTSSTIQSIAIITCFSILLLLICARKKYFKAFLCIFLSSLLLFSVGGVAFYVDKARTESLGAFSYLSNDIVFIEEGNELTLIDITNNSIGLSNEIYNLRQRLGYTEIENYVICDYSYETHYLVERITNKNLIRSLYIPLPVNETELESYNYIVNVAKNEGVALHILESGCTFGSYTISMAERNWLSRSKKRSVCFSLDRGDFKLTYLGASSFELFDYFPENEARVADVVIFGGYGPNYKLNYKYDLCALDIAIFLGESLSFADNEMLEKIKGRVADLDNNIVRFNVNY